MTMLDELDLPGTMIDALKAAGLRSAEELCAKTVREVSAIDGIGKDRIQAIKEIRNGLSKHGLDLRGYFEDPVGWPNFPSRQALRGLYERMNLMPQTRKHLTGFLLRAIVRGELMALSDAADRHKVSRLLELLDD